MKTTISANAGAFFIRILMESVQSTRHILEAGFTGSRKDKNGVERFYKDGKPTKNPNAKDKPAKTKPTAQAAGQDAAAGKIADLNKSSTPDEVKAAANDLMNLSVEDLSKMADEPKEKPKWKRKSRAKPTIFSYVVRNGGISSASVQDMANYKEEIMQGGLLQAIRKNGMPISKMAEMLERQGHFTTPPDRSSDEYMLELMANKHTSALAEIKENAYDNEQLNHYKKQLENEGFSDEQIAKAIRDGQEAGAQSGAQESATTIAGWDIDDEAGDSSQTPKPASTDKGYPSELDFLDEPTPEPTSEPTPTNLEGNAAALDAIRLKLNRKPHNAAAITPDAVKDLKSKGYLDAAGKLTDSGRAYLYTSKGQAVRKATGPKAAGPITPKTQNGLSDEANTLDALRLRTNKKPHNKGDLTPEALTNLQQKGYIDEAGKLTAAGRIHLNSEKMKPAAAAQPAEPANQYGPGDTIPLKMGDSYQHAGVNLFAPKEGSTRIGIGENGHQLQTIPAESLKHFIDDLTNKVTVTPNSGIPEIDAVAAGKASHLGRGDDGSAYLVGNKVVKTDVVSPFIPTNPGHLTPHEALNRLKKQTETHNKLAETLQKQGILGIEKLEWHEHDGRGFAISNKLDTKTKLNAKQLHQVRKTLDAIHKAGFAVNDAIQVGLNESGQPILYDLGKAGKIDYGQKGSGIEQHAYQTERDSANFEKFAAEQGHKHALPLRPQLVALEKTTKRLGWKLVGKKAEDTDELNSKNQTFKNLMVKNAEDRISDYDNEIIGQNDNTELNRIKAEYLAAKDAKANPPYSLAAAATIKSHENYFKQHGIDLESISSFNNDGYDDPFKQPQAELPAQKAKIKKPATKQEFINNEIARIKIEDPGMEEEDYQAQAEANAEDWKPTVSGQFDVDQAVMLNGKKYNYRGKVNKDGKTFAVLAGGNMGQITVPIENINHPDEELAALTTPTTADEPGFTGIDAQGREWQNGELVAAKDEPATEPKTTVLDDNTSMPEHEASRQVYLMDLSKTTTEKILKLMKKNHDVLRKSGKVSGNYYTKDDINIATEQVLSEKQTNAEFSKALNKAEKSQNLKVQSLINKRKQEFDTLKQAQEKIGYYGVQFAEEQTKREIRDSKIKIQKLNQEIIDADKLAPTPAANGAEPEKIGAGNTGDVTKIGNEVHKNSKNSEGKIYAELSGTPGIAPGKEENGKIVTPHYKNIISRDDIPAERRHNYGPIIKPQLQKIVGAISALSAAGYNYNDPIQLGFDADRNANLFDFSNAEKSNDASESNLDHLSNFLTTFGLAKDAAAISKVASVLRYAKNQDSREFVPDDPEAIAATKILDNLNGKEPTHAYYVFNKRTIPNAAQSENIDGVKVVLSAGPLPQKLIDEYELQPALTPPAAADEPGFTGIDSLGREWRNGELVAAKEEPTAQEPSITTTGGAESTPEPEPNPVPDPVTKPSTPAAAAAEPEQTPREEAKQHSEEIKSDYYNARPSAIPNIGGDIANAARHRYSTWEGLDKAEENGTAEALVNKKNLLKNEPSNLSSFIDTKPVLSILTAHYILNAFPAEVGNYNEYRDGAANAHSTPEKIRQQYYLSLNSIKALTESLVEKGATPEEIREKTKDKILDLIEVLRKSSPTKSEKSKAITRGLRTSQQKTIYYDDYYNPVANRLIKMLDAFESQKASGYWYAIRKTSIEGRVKEFSDQFSKKYNNRTSNLDIVEMNERLQSHALDIVTGVSLPKSFDTSKENKNKYDESQNFTIGPVTRTGGTQITLTPENISTTGEKMFKETLQLRGVQFGNSVPDQERIYHAQKTAEAFLDLTDILNFAPESIGLGGKLGMAIGARGKAGALAHFEPNNIDKQNPENNGQVINLTRRDGAGSLAHEWGHALDYSLNESDQSYGSDAKTYATNHSKRTDQLMAELKLKVASSGYYNRFTKDLASERGMTNGRLAYYQDHKEIFARLFETYVQKKLNEAGRENTYLSRIRHGAAPYPTDAEFELLRPNLDALMDEIRQKPNFKPSNKTQPTDKAAPATPPPPPPPPPPTTAKEPELSAIRKAWKQRGSKADETPYESFQAVYGRRPTYQELHGGKGGLIEKLNQNPQMFTLPKQNPNQGYTVTDVTPAGFGPAEPTPEPTATKDELSQKVNNDEIAATAKLLSNNQGQRIGQYDWNVNGNKIIVAHSVTGREYGEISLENGKVLPNKSGDEKALNVVYDAVKAATKKRLANAKPEPTPEAVMPTAPNDHAAKIALIQKIISRRGIKPPQPLKKAKEAAGDNDPRVKRIRELINQYC